MNLLSISRFPRVESKTPRRAELSWTDLCKLLTTFDIRADKDGPMWSPATYPRGKTVLAVNVAAVSCLVLDFDCGIAPGAVRKLWTDWAYCIHRTHSATAEHPKFRAVFPLVGPWEKDVHELVEEDGETWYDVHHRLATVLGGGFIDTTGKDPSRKWFLPAIPEGEEPYSLVHAGRWLPWTDLDRFPEPPPPVVLPTAPRYVPTNDRMPAEAMIRTALGRVALVGRNPAGFDLAVQCRDNDYSLWETEEIVAHDFRGRCPLTNTKGEVEEYTEAEALHSVRSAFLGRKREPSKRALPVETGRKGGVAMAKAGGRKARGAAVELDPGAENGRVALAPGLPESGPPGEAGEVAPAAAGDTSEKALGHRFARETRGRYLTTDGGAWWRYQDGVWRPVDRHRILALVELFLEPVATGNQYARLIESVAKIGGLRMHVPLSRMDAHPDWIALQNGVLDVREKRWIDHSPTNLLTTQLPFAYDEQAACPRWRQFLNEVLVDENGVTSMELIRLVQEWFGYCLVPDARAQTTMWWLGGGANGKGVATKILESLVGPEQRVGVDIEQLHEPYHRANLQGKLLGIVGEIPLRAMIKNGARFKELVSGDTISARSPGKDVFTFTPYVRLLCTANDLPRTFDRSAGYFRRIKIVPFRLNLPEEARDANLTDTLLGEISGIFNWALEGLYRFYAQGGKFSMTPEADRALEGYRKEEDPVARYIEDWCSKDPSSTETFMELWGCYRRWCKVNGESFESSTTFSRALTRLGLETRTEREGNVTRKVRKGIKIEVRGFETSFGDQV